MAAYERNKRGEIYKEKEREREEEQEEKKKKYYSVGARTFYMLRVNDILRRNAPPLCVYTPKRLRDDTRAYVHICICICVQRKRVRVDDWSTDATPRVSVRYKIC